MPPPVKLVNINSKLIEIKRDKYTIAKPFGYSMFSRILPEYSKNSKITELITNGLPDYKWFSKSILFNPNKIFEINYSPGCHECNPVGIIKQYSSDDLKLLHYKYIDFNHVIQRMMIYLSLIHI